MESKTKMDVTVLYVEDDEATRSAIGDMIARRVRALITAGNGKEGLDTYQEHRPEIVVTDIRMPVMSGLAMSKKIKALNNKTMIIVTSAHNDTNYFLDAIEIGIDRFVLKPIEQKSIISALENCAAIVNREKEELRLRREREILITELQESVAKTKLLSGLLPICSSCKKIRDDKGYWNQIESYIRGHSEAEFTHGICPDCAVKLYPDIFKE